MRGDAPGLRVAAALVVGVAALCVGSPPAGAVSEVVCPGAHAAPTVCAPVGLVDPGPALLPAAEPPGAPPAPPGDAVRAPAVLRWAAQAEPASSPPRGPPFAA